ncbi:MAG: hypothetical protein IH609_19500 [Dehalococcoidia bacterium]|nr:hypothetical protein [Dehalococcoidia bacterium]
MTIRQHRHSPHEGRIWSHDGASSFGGIVDEGWKKHTFLHPRDSGVVRFQLFEEPHAAK